MPATGTSTRISSWSAAIPNGAAITKAVQDDLYQAALDLGGTVTGEHGIGSARVAWLEAQRGADAVRVMRAIKAALDPQGLLNPGRVVAEGRSGGTLADRAERPRGPVAGPRPGPCPCRRRSVHPTTITANDVLIERHFGACGA